MRLAAGRLRRAACWPRTHTPAWRPLLRRWRSPLVSMGRRRLISRRRSPHGRAPMVLRASPAGSAGADAAGTRRCGHPDAGPHLCRHFTRRIGSPLAPTPICSPAGATRDRGNPRRATAATDGGRRRGTPAPTPRGPRGGGGGALRELPHTATVRASCGMRLCARAFLALDLSSLRADLIVCRWRGAPADFAQRFGRRARRRRASAAHFGQALPRRAQSRSKRGRLLLGLRGVGVRLGEALTGLSKCLWQFALRWSAVSRKK